MLNTKMTMGEAIRQMCLQRSDQEELVCGSTRLTYPQLLARIDNLSHGLSGLGVRKGDRVAALLPPGPEFVYLFFALAQLGAVVLPLNPQIR